MKKFYYALLLSLVLLTTTNIVNAQAVRENKSFKEDNSIMSLWGARKKTVVKNYTHQNSVPNSIPYSEYYENCWWSGNLNRSYMHYDPKFQWYSATFEGTLKKTDCFNKIALDENGEVIGEIMSIEGPNMHPNLLLNSDAESELSSYAAKKREIRIKLPSNQPPNSTYYYEEYDQSRGCYFGGTLLLVRTYQENGNTIAVYSGYINSAC